MNKIQDNPLIEGLRAAGAKITAQRIAICNWLYGNHSHPTAAAVYEALRDDFPTMSLATVYNTLSLLEKLDLIHEIGRASDGSARYDADTEPHLNLVCTVCERVIDIPDVVDSSELERAAAEHGFQIHDASFVAHGICADCQRDAESHQKEMSEEV